MLYLFFGNNCKGTRARSCDRQHIVQSLVIRIHHKTVLLRKIFCSIGFHNDVSAFVRPLYNKAQHFKVLFQTLVILGQVHVAALAGIHQLFLRHTGGGLSGGCGLVRLLLGDCLLLRGPMLRLFFGSIADDVFRAAMIYFTITAISYPFLALYNAGAAIFRSVGNSEASMRVSVIMNITNIVGNAFCIFVLRMGVAGVAVPTLVSRVLGAVIILKLTTRHDNVARVTWDGVKHLQPQMAKNILYIGIPSALENSLFQLGRVLVVSMISLFGTVHISANAVANNLDGMGCIVGQAIGLAMITVVGRCVGAQQLDQASYFTKKLLLWDYIAQGATNALILIFLNPLLSVYTLSDETRHLAWLLVMIHAGSAIFLWPAGFVLPNALRAANDVRFTMLTSILSMGIWRLAFSYILCVQMGMGAVGVWIAMVVDWVCRVTCFVVRFVSGAWKKKCVAK